MINIIVACGHDRVIGQKGKLPWEIKEDWEYFLDTTKGGVLIMGRNCFKEFESYAQERKVIVLTRNPNLSFKYARSAPSLRAAISLAEALGETIWICGGENIYREAMPYADLLYITKINRKYDGDVYFPPWEEVFRKEISRNEILTNNPSLEFLVFAK